MLDRLFASIVKQGTLTLLTADGRRMSFGAGAPEVSMRLHDRRSYYEMALNPELKLGELYMDGRLSVENGDIADLLDLLMANLTLVRPGCRPSCTSCFSITTGNIPAPIFRNPTKHWTKRRSERSATSPPSSISTSQA
jgi:hypothetical protein